MQKYLLLFFFLECANHSYSIKISPLNNPQADHVFLTIPGTDISINLADYALLKPSDFKKLTGNKLTWKESIVFKITQKKIKKAIRKDGTVDLLAFNKKTKEPFKWHWGGFFLGLLLPIVGMVIAAFIKDNQKKNRVNSAAIGTLIVSAAFLIFLLSSF